MLSTKFVIRVMDANEQLLGWTETHAVAKGDGYLRADGPVYVCVERGGVATTVSVHWADVHVETRATIRESVTSGQVLTIFPTRGTPIMRCGHVPGPLPAVTERRPLHIVPGTGGMGVRAWR
jgi:hypothetical protein